MKRSAIHVLVAWLSTVGLDVVIHGGILAPFYATRDPFLLPPEVAFRRIPLGYAGLLLLAILLVWLSVRADVRGVRRGVGFGLALGGLVWGGVALGLASITSARPGLLLGWFLGQTAESGVAGGFVGAGRAGARSSRLVGLAIGLVGAGFAIVVGLQSAGWVPVPAVR